MLWMSGGFMLQAFTSTKPGKTVHTVQVNFSNRGSASIILEVLILSAN